MPRSAPSRRAIGLALALLVGVVLGWRQARAVTADLSRSRDLHHAQFAGSRACIACHPSHYESWHRTFHRPMNAEASPDTVRGAFDGRSLDWRGVRATMDRDASGAYRMTFTDLASGRVLERDVIARTVGSHRYQQYLTRRGELYLRLPVAWHVEEQRFFHLASAFFAPDPPDDRPVWPEEYGRYVARWNDNCVFCHTVAPNPGRDASTGKFHTDIAELGIACEACHGPAAEHARANRDPTRRYVLHAGHRADPTVVNPTRLSASRSADLCGRCHGQRMADDVGRFMAHGDPFVPGDDLARYTAPLWRDTTLHGRDDVFAPRFWPDGTPRLTAYEYQGFLQSACTAAGSLTCTSCHTMHGGDPRGQLRADARGDGACTGCHHALADVSLAARHTHHHPGTGSPRCVDCHMPRIVYGILDVHRSHRIESPDPARSEANARPDACTLCHVDRSRAWAIDATGSLWPRAARTSARDTGTEGASALPETQRALFGGDPVERAIVADALGRAAPATDPRLEAARCGALLEALRGDSYATVRQLAWRALRRRLGASAPRALVTFDPSWPRAQRDVSAIDLATGLGEHAIAPEASLVETLRARADERAIEVGE